MAKRIEFGFERAHSSFKFKFQCRRDLPLGDVTVDQYWMDVPALYSQKKSGQKRVGHNHRELLRFYWQSVVLDGSHNLRAPQEKYLLASIVPVVRAQGSRRVFADAFLARGSQQSRHKASLKLGHDIDASLEKEMSPLEFQDKTFKLLGPEEYSDEVDVIQSQIANDLLDDACRLLMQGDVDGAKADVHVKWLTLNSRYGRRPGFEQEKLALDIISYEARAAFHQAYCQLWACMLEILHKAQRISDVTWAFLRFWHTEWIDVGNGIPLFQGHLFGLHPAGGMLLQTQAGCNLMGRWLADTGSRPKFHQLLHAYFVALCHYQQRRGDRLSPLKLSEDIEELDAERHRDGRKGGPRNDD